MHLDPDTGRRVCHGSLVSLPENMYASAPVIPSPFYCRMAYPSSTHARAEQKLLSNFPCRFQRPTPGPLKDLWRRRLQKAHVVIVRAPAPAPTRVAFTTPRSPETAVPGEEVYVRPRLLRT